MRLQSRPPRRASENVVPLINVVFLLLVFFMLTGTLAATPPVDIALPRVAADGAPPPAADSARVVGLSASGALILDGETTTAAGLAGRLRAAGVRAVALRADARTPSRALLPALEALEDAGVTQVDLVTELAP